MVDDGHAVGCVDHHGRAVTKLAVVDDDFDREDDDFLAYWRQHRTPTFKRIFGIEVEVPRDLPLNFGDQYEQIKDSEEPEDFKTLLGVIFGQGVLDQWIERGISREQVQVLLTWGILNGSGQDTSFDEAAKKAAEIERESAGKAQPMPNRAERRASSKTAASAGTGRSSKPTSNASTKSTGKPSRRSASAAS